MRLSGSFLFVGALAACSSAGAPRRSAASASEAPQFPSFIAPVNLAEGHTGKPEASAPPPGPSTSPPPEAAHPASDAPDPDPPLKTAVFFRYRVTYVKGDVRVLGITRVELAQPVATARRVGRFAFELFIGKELVERVRFDFPLLSGDAPASGPPGGKPARFTPGTESTLDVMVPESDRATMAALVDRLTGRRVALPYPPDLGPVAVPAASAAPAASAVPP